MKHYTEEMGEISGFGGGYEKTCRKMVLAGVEWLEKNPTANPQFHGFNGIYGVIIGDNQDAKNLTAAVLKGGGDDITGAMHQAAISHIFAVKRHGWPEYCRQMKARKVGCDKPE